MNDKKTFWGRCMRLLRYKLVIPLKRSQESIDYIARGVSVGLAWAMTPLVGIQMTTVLLTWIVGKFFKWRFSLVIACAWTWVTNVVTMWPIYYVFYVTGKLLMGQVHSINAYTTFLQAAKEAFSENTSFWEIGRSIMIFMKLLLQDWGIAMAVGCLPWLVASAWLGYVLSYRWLSAHRAKTQNREERRAYWRARLARKGKRKGK